MGQEYSDPKRADDPHALPDVEVFYVQAGEIDRIVDDELAEDIPAGFYWWSCSPGCLPDSEPNGPFDTYAEALSDAREGCDE